MASKGYGSKFLTPRKLDDKNYQTWSQICGSKVVPKKIWGLPKTSPNLCFHQDDPICFEEISKLGAAIEVQLERFTMRAPAVGDEGFMAYSFHEGLTLAWKHQIRQAGFMFFFPPSRISCILSPEDIRGMTGLWLEHMRPRTCQVQFLWNCHIDNDKCKPEAAWDAVGVCSLT